MAKQPVGVWGIDLGQCGLKALRVEEGEGGELAATAFDYVEHPKILSQPDADPDQLTREALEKFLSRNTLKGDLVAISVPGQSGLARFVKLPPVEEKKIQDIVRFEAKQQIPFNLDEVVWDYQKLGSGAVTDGFAMETEIGLFAMKRDMVNRYLQHFKDVGVEVHIVQMAPLALCNYVAYDLLKKGTEPEPNGGGGKRPCVVALDVGTDSSNLVITDGARIIWQRPIPLGGNHFTRALTKDLKLTFAKAEHLKRNATKSPDLKKILTALKPVLNDFVGEVQRSLGYFTNTHRDAQIEYMVGLGNAFRLPGLQRYMAEKLSLDVRKLAKLERLPGEGVVNTPAFAENVLTFPVAYGLALQGVKQARLVTNLLPPEIHIERLVRAKKPWAAAAAAALLLGIGGMALGYGLEWNAYGRGIFAEGTKAEGGSGPLADAKKKALAAKQAYDSGISKFEEAKRKAEEESKAIDSIVAGIDEQLNWLKLYRFLDKAVPRPHHALNTTPGTVAYLVPYLKGDNPDDRRLNGALQDYVRDGGYALRAWEQWRVGKKGDAKEDNKGDKGNKGAKSGKAKDEMGPWAADLIQVNIEAVDARYTPKLSVFWANLPKEVKDEKNPFVRPVSDLKNAPAEGDKGWIVELRGYTYHEGGRVFILNTLMERLARMGVEEPPTKLAAPPGEGGSAAPAPAPAPAPAGGGAVQSGTAQGPPAIRPVSHVILYNNATKQASASTPFEIIESSKLASVIGGGAAGEAGGRNRGMGMQRGEGPGPVMPPSPGGGPSLGGGEAGGTSQFAGTGWTPLGGTNLSGSPAGGDAPGGMLTPGGMPTPGGSVPPRGRSFPPGGDIRPPGLPAPGGGRLPTPGATDEVTRTRTEFVIFFIWREPTPSDRLLTKKTEPVGGVAGGASGFGGGTGSTGPGGQ